MTQEIEWLPISEAPHDEPLWLFSPDFVDDDFNPTGVVDGFWNDETGWTIWRWNGCHDCYDTIEGADPTCFAQKIPPTF